MIKGDIVKELNSICKEGVLKKTEFWLSNKTALVMYGIKKDVDYIGINCRRQIFKKVLNSNKSYVARKVNKKRIIDIKGNILLFEDNRPYKACIIEGFRVETINSILSKKFFYGTVKDFRDIKQIEEEILRKKNYKENENE